MAYAIKINNADWKGRPAYVCDQRTHWAASWYDANIRLAKTWKWRSSAERWISERPEIAQDVVKKAEIIEIYDFVLDSKS